MPKTVRSASDEVDANLEALRKILQPLSSKELTKEDLRESIENLKGFFQVLLDWYDAEQKKRAKEDILSE